MQPAVIIAIVAAVPGTIAAWIQYKNRAMNPKENGVDWVVHRYRELAAEAAEREDRAERRAVRAETRAIAAERMLRENGISPPSTTGNV
jgi:hypothetical protein